MQSQQNEFISGLFLKSLTNNFDFEIGIFNIEYFMFDVYNE